jgi:plasmid maintenance system killer protein
MNVALTERALAALATAQPAVQKAFIKQISILARDLRHPSLRAKKYDESQDIWQARINDDWRFYFKIAQGVYTINSIIPHPK